MWMATMKINVLLEVSCLFWAPNGGSKLLFSPSRIRTIARKGEEEKKNILPGGVAVATIVYLEAHLLDRRV